MQLSSELARELLQIKAVQINPTDYFTWTSGIQSPIYCDNRITMSYPEVRTKIAAAFEERVSQMAIKPDVIAGCATAGIPHAAWLADRLNLPMVYVRSKPKAHGKGNQIEGGSVQGKNVIVIEDLISTGGSSLEAVEALRKAGAEVLEVMSIFSYGLSSSYENFEKANIAYQSLTNYDALLQALVEDGKLTDREKSILLDWRNALES
ncbi:orotate phosphoribosyltransferase [Ornithinibacillus massiliensis]|uniref:Orotate phosphoribosyltransferase n=1 Tax=Ornithinibacillus massiliensis TaxID=1944633 RepID=A0ABS5MCR2_9BACI|nr:orotate phosphoribosyltransferase [Ornithinibacillus massiliensis]MBS3680111.1 orotate phosphoribosyltransferase [Ornithinibacillus massiliensis]